MAYAPVAIAQDATESAPTPAYKVMSVDEVLGETIAAHQACNPAERRKYLRVLQNVLHNIGLGVAREYAWIGNELQPALVAAGGAEWAAAIDIKIAETRDPTEAIGVLDRAIQQTHDRPSPDALLRVRSRLLTIRDLEDVHDRLTRALAKIESTPTDCDGDAPPTRVVASVCEAPDEMAATACQVGSPLYLHERIMVALPIRIPN